MITAIILALSYWILGLLFALFASCVIGSLIGLFLSLLASFKSPMRLVAVPLWVVFSFGSLGACWFLQWSDAALVTHHGQDLQYWFVVGALIPGILCLGFVPKIISLATHSNRNAVRATPASTKV